MPCNAKVVLKAKIAGQVPVIDKVKSMAVSKGWTVQPIQGGYSITINYGTYQVLAEVKGNEVTMKSYVGDWNTGVSQLKALTMLLSKQANFNFSDVGKPETHRHEHVGAMQQVPHSH